MTRKSSKRHSEEARDREDCLAALFDNHRDELVVFARSKVGEGPPDPEDITQQAFARYAALSNPNSILNKRAFLYRTVTNLILDYFKAADYRRSVAVAPKDIEEISVDHDQISPEIVLLDKERYSLVLKVVENLPRRQRRFLILNRFDGMSYTEIAERNGVSISTARRDVELAVGKCRQALARLNDHDKD